MESEQFGSFQQCYQAYKACRRYKRKSSGVLQFERKLLDELSTLSERLQTRQWQPSRSVCFIVTRPKAREIHAAVDRLQGFMKRGIPPIPNPSPARGEGGKRGHYLQLDIKNFFNCIDREILYGLLKKHLAKMERKGNISPAKHEWLCWLCHRMLAQHPARNVLYVGREKRAAVPPIVTGLASQTSWFRQQYPEYQIVMQVGWKWGTEDPHPNPSPGGRGAKEKLPFLLPAPLAGEGLGKGGNGAAGTGAFFLRVVERGYLNNGLKRRVVVEIHG